MSALMETLRTRGVDFRIVTGGEWDRHAWWADRVFRVPSVGFFLYRDYKVGWPAVPGLTRMLDAFEPELIHAANPTLSGVFAAQYARRQGIPVVTTYHTRFPAYLSYYGLATLEPAIWGYMRWFHRLFDITYAPTEVAARELREQGIGNVQLWSRGVDTARFDPVFRSDALRASVGATPDIPLLLFVGRMVKEKDLADLIGAAELLRARGRRFRLAMVGDGPMRAELERAAPYAHFAGLQVGESLARWYASADVLVFPSTTETFGNVVLEAFASRLPVVGVRRGGVAELVEDGVNGFLAAPQDPQDLADVVDRLLRDPLLRERLRTGAIRAAVERDWTQVNDALLASYDRLIRRTVPAADAAAVTSTHA
jgi:glycosyltransferase involved in cell wall biosynthesis